MIAGACLSGKVGPECHVCGKDASTGPSDLMFRAFLAFLMLAVAIRMQEDRDAQADVRRRPECGPGQVLVPCKWREAGDHNSDCRCGGTGQIAVCAVCKGDDWIDEETPCVCKGAR